MNIEEMATSASGRHFYATLAKGLKVLSLFNKKRAALSLKSISQMTGINPATVYNLVNTLVELGFLSRDENARLIKVGPNAVILGHNLMTGHLVMMIVQKFIKYASVAHRLSIYAVILENGTLISQFEGDAFDYYDIITFPCDKLCYCTALGKALLAFFPEEEREAITHGLKYERKTDNTITNRDDLLADLEKTRSRGYAINREEYRNGILSIAAPFFNLGENKLRGAVCFDFYTRDYTLEQIEKAYLDILLKLVKDISDAIPA